MRPKKSILVVPHFDDEIFETGGVLLNYPNEISLVFTHPSDCISKETFEKQKLYLYKCLEYINQYRSKKDYIPINIDKVYINEDSEFNGYMSSTARRNLQAYLENLFEFADLNDCKQSVNFIDYFIYTCDSSHQSHTESHRICNSICRSPFIEQCKDIMLSTYPQSEYGINVSQKQINAYLPLSEEQVEILCYCIGVIYGEKNYNTTILGADNFKTYLNFFGSKCGKNYAQPFITQRHIYTMSN